MTSPFAIRPLELVRAFIMVAALFLMMLMGAMHILHMCALRSWWVEAPLTLVPIVPVLILIGQPRNVGLSFLWFCLSMTVLFLAHRCFLHWMHSKDFPQWLLTSGSHVID